MTEADWHFPPNEASLSRAKASDPDALWRLYGLAAACLREGAPMPTDLAAWLAERMEALSQAVRATKGAPESERDKAVMQALQVRRKTRGRPKSSKAETLGVLLAQHVLSEMVIHNLRPRPACDVVGRWFEKEQSRKGQAPDWAWTPGVTDPVFIYDAWLKHGKAAMKAAGIVKRPKN